MPEAHAVDLLNDLAVIMSVAAVTTLVFQKLRQPVVLGYLLAGMVVGPHLPVPILANPDVAHTLSELGVVLLMFSRVIYIVPLRWRDAGDELVGIEPGRTIRPMHSSG